MRKWKQWHTTLFWASAAFCLGYALIEYLYDRGIEYESIGLGVFFLLMPLYMRRKPDSHAETLR